MKVSRSRIGIVNFLVPEGALTRDTLPDLAGELEASLSRGEVKVIIDFHFVSGMDSVALEALVEAHLAFRRKGGALKVANLNPICRDIFLATRLETMFEVYSDLDKTGRSFLI
jgi:anti-anti-sigma factor